MVVTTQKNLTTATLSVEVVTTTSSKQPTFSGKHGNNWTMGEMKMTAHLMDKGLKECLNPDFKNRLPVTESGPFDLTTDDGKKFKEAVDLNKKVMGQFIQAFSTINLMNKVNLQKKADKQIPSGKGWKLWEEMQEEYNPDDSIAETELELALSKLQLNNKKNPQKFIEEIASCEVKYGIPISNRKKMAQLICIGGTEYGTVITVAQMCKKTKGVTCTSKHIVDKMWKQLHAKGRKDRGKENSDCKEEASLAKADDKTKGKKKIGNKDKKKERQTCNHCNKKGHIKANCWQKDPSQIPKQFWERKDAKTEKATAAVKEEHILLIVDMEVEDEVEYEFHNDAAVGVVCLDMNDAFIKVQVVEDNAFVQIELGLKKKDEPNDVSQIRPTLQALSSPNMWIRDTGALKHSTKHRQGGIIS
jgi:hypothetical protein